MGGGVLDGRLLSLYLCPGCSEPLRFMGLFDDAHQATKALTGLEKYMEGLEVVRCGRMVVGACGDRRHYRTGQAYSGLVQCDRRAFPGTGRELVLRIWKAFHVSDWDEKTKPPPFPAVGRVDPLKLKGIVRVSDQMNPKNAPLLVMKGDWLTRPQEEMTGTWDSRESWEKYERRRDNAKGFFVKTVLVA